METKKTLPVATRVEEDLHRAAHRKAHAQGRTLAVVIRAFLRAWVTGEVPDPPFGAESSDESGLI